MMSLSPQGTVCSTGGVPGIRFVTTQDAILSAGSWKFQWKLQSEEGGRDANTAAHTICVLVTPPLESEGKSKTLSPLQEGRMGNGRIPTGTGDSKLEYPLTGTNAAVLSGFCIAV